jgi:hypothetical protein
MGGNITEKAPLAVLVRTHWGGTRRTGGSGACM